MIHPLKKSVYAFLFILSGMLLFSQVAYTQDLGKSKVQYIVIGTHIDTEYEWTLKKTINEYIPATLDDNFKMFEKYPGYILNFEGAYRYSIMKQYYPEKYEKLKYYVKKGNWSVNGAMWEAIDANLPSAESIIRQILYGNLFFEKEFGLRCIDVYLTDSPGYNAAFPSLLSHCGIKGFSTQKTYASWLPSPVGAIPKPFDIGVWEGVDGESIVAVLDPGTYVSGWDIRLNQINTLGAISGIYAAYDYMGNGDIGGACCCNHRGCNENDVISLYDRIKQNDTSEVKVIISKSDQLFRDLTVEQISKLPRYKGDIIMREHGTGLYTARPFMKYKNRKNEISAYAAESSSVIDLIVNKNTYPADKISHAWLKILQHQMHDDITGGCIPEVYKTSIADEDTAYNEFQSIINNSSANIIASMNTSVKGMPVVVYNPMAIPRQDIATITLKQKLSPNQTIKVFNTGNREVPAQIIKESKDSIQIIFLADTPPLSYSVFYVIIVKNEDKQPLVELQISEKSMENNKYIVTIDKNGNICSIRDKELAREVIAEPVQLLLFKDCPKHYPQYEVAYSDLQEPKGMVDGKPEIKILENGPVRIKMQVLRHTAGSIFIENISLCAGDASDNIEIENTMDWHTDSTLLKVSFPLGVSNNSAVYDLGLGVSERGTNTMNQYEVPVHQWAELTNSVKDFGIAILNDSKYGMDKPTSNTLRLTLQHSPAGGYNDSIKISSTRYALYAHKGDWRQGNVVNQALCFNHPLMAFNTTKHQGKLGREISLLNINKPDNVAIMSIKKAEKNSNIIIRFRETKGEKAENINISFMDKILHAYEVNGMEDRLGDATINDKNKLRFDLTPFQLKTFEIVCE
jgi:alpha-mannosidase